MTVFVNDASSDTLRSLLEGAIAETDAGDLSIDEILEIAVEWAEEVAEVAYEDGREQGREQEWGFLLDDGRGIALVPAEHYVREVRVEQALDDIGLRVVQWWQLTDDAAGLDNLGDDTAILELHLSDLYELSDARRRARAFP